MNTNGSNLGGQLEETEDLLINLALRFFFVFEYVKRIMRPINNLCKQTLFNYASIKKKFIFFSCDVFKFNTKQILF